MAGGQAAAADSGARSPGETAGPAAAEQARVQPAAPQAKARQALSAATNGAVSREPADSAAALDAPRDGTASAAADLARNGSAAGGIKREDGAASGAAVDAHLSNPAPAPDGSGGAGAGAAGDEVDPAGDPGAEERRAARRKRHRAELDAARRWDLRARLADVSADVELLTLEARYCSSPPACLLASTAAGGTSLQAFTQDGPLA